MPVYFIGENENADYERLRIKIGKSKNIVKRLAQLRTGSPYDLGLMGWIEANNDLNLEKQLHQKYKNKRAHLEWFNLSVSDVLQELKSHSTNSYIALNDNAFEVASFDCDGIPELVGAWQWAQVEYEEFCPSCGWGGGLSYNENFNGERCLKCGLIANYV